MSYLCLLLHFLSSLFMAKQLFSRALYTFLEATKVVSMPLVIALVPLNFLIGCPLPRRKCPGVLALSKTKHTGLISVLFFLKLSFFELGCLLWKGHHRIMRFTGFSKMGVISVVSSAMKLSCRCLM